MKEMSQKIKTKVNRETNTDPMIKLKQSATKSKKQKNLRQKIVKISQVQWHSLAILATGEAEAGGWLEGAHITKRNKEVQAYQTVRETVSQNKTKP